MTNQNSKFFKTFWNLICNFDFCILIFAFCLNFPKFVFAENKWSGVDETVVEKFAEDAGRKAWTPFINTDQGDLLLFVFLLAGTIGGFVLGYFFRKIFAEKADMKNVN